MRALLARLRALARNIDHTGMRRAERDADLDAELRAYVDQLADRYRRDGMSPDDARRAALLATGGVTQVKEATRDAWLGHHARSFARDVRFASRSLRKAPGFVVLAVLTLSVAIGGATAIVSVVRAVLLQPLSAVGAPAELFTVERVTASGELDDVSYPDYLDLRDRARTVSGLAAYNGTWLNIEDARTGGGRAWISYVSDNFFSVLAVSAVMGRVFQPEDAGRFSASPVAVISHRLWKNRFAGDSTILGSTLRINEQSVTVIGIAPDGFVGAMRLHPMDLWVSVFTMRDLLGDSLNGLRDRGSRGLRLIGRRASGASLADARREIEALSAQLASAYPEDRHLGIRVSGGSGMIEDERIEAARTPRLLAIAMALLLLIACASVAGLTLVRAAAKRRELATRLALGASRFSLVRQLVVEAAVVAGLAGAFGVLFAQGIVRVASVMRTVVSVPDFTFALDWRTLATAFVISSAVALLVAIVPAFQISRTDVAAAMKDGAGGAVRARARSQRMLVVAQLAASLVMLASASILFGALRRTMHIDPGFDTRGLRSVFISLSGKRFDSTGVRTLLDEVMLRTRSDSRIGPVALTSAAPPAPWLTMGRVFRENETPSRARLNDPSFSGGARAYVDATSNGLFAVLGVPVLLGRDFTWDETRRRAPVAIVSRRLADLLWPNANPLGQMISWPSTRGPERAPLRVVGVVGDIHHSTLAAGPSPVLYVADVTRLRGSPTLVYRDTLGTAATALRALFASMRVNVEVADDDRITVVDDGMVRQRIVGSWVTAFGSIALVLAALGVYGVIALSVQQRTRELAVRAAVGARPVELLRLVLADGLRLGATGVAIGAGGTVLAFRALRSVFAGMQLIDLGPAAFALVVLAAATFLASLLPARRAARLNPADALRTD